MWVAVGVALTSALLFAIGSSLQHRSAESHQATSKTRLLTGLLGRREWLFGALLSAAAFALHATALHLGSLSLVQPVIVTGIVFTVIVRAAIDRRRPSRSTIAWAGLTWAGLVLFIATLKPGPDHRPDDSLALIVTGIGVVLAAALVLLARGTRRRVRRGLLLATAAGVLFGLVAGLVKLSTSAANQGVLHLVTQWAPWVLIAVGLGAVGLNQLAYRSTRISVTTPVLNIAQLLVAMTFGFVIFSEKLLDSPTSIVAQLVGLAAMGFGVARLARSADDGPAESADLVEQVRT